MGKGKEVRRGVCGGHSADKTKDVTLVFHTHGRVNKSLREASIQ